MCVYGCPVASFVCAFGVHIPWCVCVPWFHVVRFACCVVFRVSWLFVILGMCGSWFLFLSVSVAWCACVWCVMYLRYWVL